MLKVIKKYRYEIVLLSALLVLVALGVIVQDQLEFLKDRRSFQSFIQSFGPLAPVVIILFIIFEVIIAPLPGFIPLISAGFIFGLVKGSIYSYIGNVVGTLLVFWIARRFGRLAAEKFFSQRRLAKYEKIITKSENYLLATFFFPIFPTDIISVAFGLSKIKFKKFALVIVIGFVSNVIFLNAFGDFLAKLYF